MSVRCPECRCDEIRLHATLVRLSFRPRWRFFGRLRPRLEPASIECSCARCLYAFIAREDGTSPAPRQDAFNQLKALKDGVRAAANGPAPERKEPIPLPRPAPDPRVKRR